MELLGSKGSIRSIQSIHSKCDLGDVIRDDDSSLLIF